MGRKLGQHFLCDAQLAARIAQLAGAAPDSCVLEVGPGRGALTQALLAAGARLAAVEVDAALIPPLQARWGAHPRFRLLQGDILRCALHPQALFGSSSPYSVAANLPYYLTTPFLLRAARERTHFRRLILMVQREVALRICAGVQDKKAYGALSIAMQRAFGTALNCHVPPAVFRPRPKVHSAVITLIPREESHSPAWEQAFAAHIKALFSRRRKRLLSVLSVQYPQLLQENPALQARLARLVGERRAEALSVAEHTALFSLLHPPD